MTRPKAVTISKPFDARHVGGVSVPGVTIPIVGVERSFTTDLEPDEPPSHTNVASGVTEIPRRSNTIAHTLSRPSLRLKTSISRLRARSSSNSPETLRRGERDSTTERPGTSAGPARDMAAPNLKMKSSMARLRQRVGLDVPPPQPNHPVEHQASAMEQTKETTKVEQKTEILSRVSMEKVSENNTPPPPIQKDYPPLKVKTSVSRITSHATASSPEHYLPPQQNTFSLFPKETPQKKPLLVRPKRADSGTAIDFDDVPVEERPLGFKEIMAVKSLQERMALYKKTREYWAKADHGLGEWVGRAGGYKPLAFQV